MNTPQTSKIIRLRKRNKGAKESLGTVKKFLRAFNSLLEKGENKREVKILQKLEKQLNE